VVIINHTTITRLEVVVWTPLNSSFIIYYYYSKTFNFFLPPFRIFSTLFLTKSRMRLWIQRVSFIYIYTFFYKHTHIHIFVKYETCFLSLKVRFCVSDPSWKANLRLQPLEHHPSSAFSHSLSVYCTAIKQYTWKYHNVIKTCFCSTPLFTESFVLDKFLNIWTEYINIS